MTRLPRPNPDIPGLSPGVITAGTPAAAGLVRQHKDGAAFALQTWKLHQGHCETCAEHGDDPEARPGCGDGYRLWYRWRNAQDRSDGLEAILAPEPAAAAPEPPAAALTLW